MEQSTEVLGGGTEPKVGRTPESPRVTETPGDGSAKRVPSGEFDEPPPQLHAKTFVAVLAICMLYFTQNFCIVGAGAVSLDSDPVGTGRTLGTTILFVLSS